MKKSFEDILNEKSQNFQVKMRENMWDNIESQLPPEEKKKRFLFFWNKPFLAAASLSLLIAFAYLTNQWISQQSQNQITQEMKIDESKKSIIVNETEKGEIIEESKVENNFKSKKIVQSHKSENKFKSQAFQHNDLTQKVLISNVDNTNFDNTIYRFEAFTSNSGLYFAQPLTTETIETELDTIISFRGSVVKKKRAYAVNFFTEASYMPAQNSSIVSIDKRYKGTEPYQSTYEKRLNGDMGMQSKNFSVSIGAQVNHFRASIGYKQNTIRYSMLVNNVKSGINASGVYNRFDYFASDTFAVESAETGAGSYTSEYQFTSIPFRVGYQFNINNKFSMLIQPEISYNKLKIHNGLVSTTESGIYVKPDIAQPSLITQSHMAFGTSLFLEYNVVKNLFIGAGINYNKAINPIENGIVSTRYQQAGLQFSLRYQLNWKKYMYF
jgi:opacity protein-like surface antigen